MQCLTKVMVIQSHILYKMEFSREVNVLNLVKFSWEFKNIDFGQKSCHF